MIVQDFKYNGKWLSNFSMASYDPEAEPSFAPREVKRGSQNSVRSSPTHYTTSYNDTLKFNFLIIKDEEIVIDNKDYILTGNEINELESWLSSPKTPKELRLQSCDDSLDEYYCGVFTEVQPYVINEDCYGLKLTFTCDAPFGYFPMKTKSAQLNKNNETYRLEVVNKSAEKYEYMFPVVTIFSPNGFSGNEKISICNSTDERNTMYIAFNEKIEGKKKIEINCMKKTIVDENDKLIPLKDIGISFNSDYFQVFSAETAKIYWLRLLPGINVVEISKSSGDNDIKVEISGKYIVKAGGF